MRHDVFISFSQKDKKVADAICETLENRGIRCWVAPRNISPGDPWGSSIINAISNSHVFVLVFSAHSNSSNQVYREVERAVDKSIPIIPFRIEKIQLSENLEYYISATHWLDAFTPPLETHLNRLTQAVERLLPDSLPRHYPDKQPVIPIIKVMRGPFKGYEKQIHSESLSIGRGKGNDFQIKDIYVTSNHCVIKRTEDGSFKLFDKSVNGTWINGQKVYNESVILRNKTTIGIGSVLFLYEYISK